MFAAFVGQRRRGFIFIPHTFRHVFPVGKIFDQRVDRFANGIQAIAFQHAAVMIALRQRQRLDGHLVEVVDQRVVPEKSFAFERGSVGVARQHAQVKAFFRG